MPSSINLRRLIIILLLGFSSGLPLALTGGTLQAWFTTAGVSIVAIGMLTLVGQPYVYKFLWAPLLDRYVPPFLGRRRGWLLITQIALLLAIAAMAFGDPAAHPFVLATLALIVAFISATQDIAFDAYRTEITAPQERGLSSAVLSGGYRLGMMLSGGAALVIAQYTSWRTAYLLMSAAMMIGLLATWFGYEANQAALDAKRPNSLYAAVVEAFREFLSRPFAWALLLLVVLYKFGDALSVSLTTPFLIRGLDFSLATVGTVNKVMGTVASMIGVFLGGALMTRVSLYRSLFLFGVLQLIAIATLFALAVVGKNYPLLVIVIFADSLFNGMGTAALMAFLMSLCNQRFTATQYALLSAVAAIGRVFVGPLAGVMVKHIGWPSFFAWSLVISLPSLLLLWWLRDRIEINKKSSA
jgi:MFS transporter, PAT family, beta-lactamase induction signal transducer AmpG